MTLPHLTDKEAEEAQNHLVYSTIELNLRSSDFLSIATSTTLCYLTFEKYFENQISTEKKEESKKDFLSTGYNKSKYSYSISYVLDIVLQCCSYNSFNPQNSCL